MRLAERPDSTMRLRLPIARIASVLLFAALCAIVAGWALQLLAPRAPVAPAGAIAQVQGPPDLSAAGQLFGGVPRAADAQVQAAPSNIQVSGVLAAGARGVALLAIDGRPAKPFAVGEPVSDGMTVRAITGDTVELDRGAGGPPMRLPAPARGSVAVLTSGPQRSSGNANMPPVSLPGVPAAAPAGLPPLPPRTLPPPPQEALTPAIAPGPVTASQPGDPGAPGIGSGNPPARMPGLAPVGSPPAAQ
jgi:general secretion pathway protein C